jgi:rhodanese-related sulfurtransferase
MMLKKGYKQLMAEAAGKARGISADEAQALLGDPSTVFVDIRDVRELERDGMIPGAFHAPRGMLEFWVDPESPYYKPVFTEDKTYVLYCASDWRGVLAAAALAEMGLNVRHLEGGFGEWKKAGRPTGARPHKPHS